MKPAKARIPLLRRVLYATLSTVGLLGLLSAGLAGAEAMGWLDSFRQDDTVLYVSGRWLKLDARKRDYLVMDAQQPEAVQDRFPVRRRAGVLRVFVVGESFVKGNHHAPPQAGQLGYGALPDWIGWLLEARWPDGRFEVVNAGASGANSFRLVEIVEEIAQVQPDLVVLGLGNNEGYAPATRFSAELQDWALYRVVKKSVLPETPKAERPAYTLQSLRPAEVERSFRANTRTMVATLRAAGAEVVLATLPINLSGLARRVDLAELGRLAAEPRCAPALPLFDAGACGPALEAAQGCPEQFLLSFKAATCLDRAGDSAGARALYEAALQLDPRGRTRPSQNQALREIAASDGAILADVEQAFIAAHPRGLPGDRHFIDDVHLDCMGYLRPARVIVEAVARAGVLDARLGPAGPDPSTAELLDEHAWDPTDEPFLADEGAKGYARQVCSPDPAAD